MTPTIVAKEGRPYLVIGSPGGRTIINTVFQTVLNVLAYEMPINKAIEAMKIHHQWLPDTQKALEKMGHTLYGTNNLGRLMGILNDTDQGVYIGASDSSSPDGAAIGY